MFNKTFLLHTYSLILSFDRQAVKVGWTGKNHVYKKMAGFPFSHSFVWLSECSPDVWSQKWAGRKSIFYHGNGLRPPCSCQGRCSKWGISLCPYRPWPQICWLVLLLCRGRVSAGNLWRSPSLRPRVPSHDAHSASAKMTQNSTVQSKIKGNEVCIHFLALLLTRCLWIFNHIKKMCWWEPLPHTHTSCAWAAPAMKGKWSLKISLNRMKQHLAAPAEHTHTQLIYIWKCIHTHTRWRTKAPPHRPATKAAP